MANERDEARLRLCQMSVANIDIKSCSFRQATYAICVSPFTSRCYCPVDECPKILRSRPWTAVDAQASCHTLASIKATWHGKKCRDKFATDDSSGGCVTLFYTICRADLGYNRRWSAVHLALVCGRVREARNMIPRSRSVDTTTHNCSAKL